jgi:hypothetical protein
MLNDATLRQRALAMGLIQTTNQALTPQQKSLAAYQEILAQTSKASGDVARTQDSMGNKIKDASQKFEDLKSKIGEVVGVVGGPLLDVLGATASAVEPLLTAFTKLPSGMQTVIAGSALLGAAFFKLREPLEGVLDKFKTIETESPKAGKAVRGLSTAFVALAALNIAGQALNKFSDAATNANVGANELTQKLLAMNFKDLGFTDASGDVTDFNTALKTATSDGFVKFAAGFDNFTSGIFGRDGVGAQSVKAIAQVDAALASMVTSGQAKEAAAAIARLREEFVKTGGDGAKFDAQFVQYRDALVGVKLAAEKAAPAVKKVADAAAIAKQRMADLAKTTGEAHRELARLYDRPSTPGARTEIQNEIDTDAAARRAAAAQAEADAKAEAARRRKEAAAAAAAAAKAAREQAISTGSSFASGIAASLASYGKLALLTDKLADARGRLTDANDRLKTSTADAAEARRTLAQLAGDTSPQAAEARAAAERKLAEAQAAGAKAAKDKAKAAADEAASKPTAKNILADVRRRLGNIRAFANAITRLKKLGLNNTMLQDLINAGPEEGLLLARAMESAGFVKEANALQRQINVQAARVGAVGAESQFGGPGPQVRIAINLDGKTVQTALVSLKRAQGGVLNF